MLTKKYTLSNTYIPTAIIMSVHRNVLFCSYKAPLGRGGERVDFDPHAMEELEQVYVGGVAHPKEEFECPICFDQTQPQDGVILKNCLHQFCR